MADPHPFEVFESNVRNYFKSINLHEPFAPFAKGSKGRSLLASKFSDITGKEARRQVLAEALKTVYFSESKSPTDNEVKTFSEGTGKPDKYFAYYYFLHLTDPGTAELAAVDSAVLGAPTTYPEIYHQYVDGTVFAPTFTGRRGHQYAKIAGEAGHESAHENSRESSEDDAPCQNGASTVSTRVKLTFLAFAAIVICAGILSTYLVFSGVRQEQVAPVVPVELFQQAQDRILLLTSNQESAREEAEQWRKKYIELQRRSEDGQEDRRGLTDEYDNYLKAIENGNLTQAEAIAVEMQISAETAHQETGSIHQEAGDRVIEIMYIRAGIAFLQFEYLKSAELYGQIARLQAQGGADSFETIRLVLGALNMSGKYETGLIASELHYKLINNLKGDYPHQFAEFINANGEVPILAAEIDTLVRMDILSANDMWLDDLTLSTERLRVLVSELTNKADRLRFGVVLSNALLHLGRRKDDEDLVHEAIAFQEQQLDYVVSRNDSANLGAMLHNLAESYGALADITGDITLRSRSISLWRESLDAFSEAENEKDYWVTVGYLASDLESYFEGTDDIAYIQEAAELRRGDWEFEMSDMSSTVLVIFAEQEYRSTSIIAALANDDLSSAIVHYEAIQALDRKIGREAYPTPYQNALYDLFHFSKRIYESSLQPNKYLAESWEYGLRLREDISASGENNPEIDDKLVKLSLASFRETNQTEYVEISERIACDWANEFVDGDHLYWWYWKLKCAELNLTLGENSYDKGGLEKAIYWSNKSLLEDGPHLWIAGYYRNRAENALQHRSVPETFLPSLSLTYE